MQYLMWVSSACRMLLPKKLASLQVDKIALQEGQRQWKSEGNFEAQTFSRFVLASMMVLPLQTGVTPSQQTFQIMAARAFSCDWTRGFGRSKIKNNLAYTRHVMKNKGQLRKEVIRGMAQTAFHSKSFAKTNWLLIGTIQLIHHQLTQEYVFVSFRCIYDPVWWNISKT